MACELTPSMVQCSYIYGHWRARIKSKYGHGMKGVQTLYRAGTGGSVYYIVPNPRGLSTIIANGPGVLVVYSGWTGEPSTEGSTYYGTPDCMTAFHFLLSYARRNKLSCCRPCSRKALRISHCQSSRISFYYWTVQQPHG